MVGAENKNRAADDWQRGMAPKLFVDGLTKKYNSFLALDSISFSLNAGEISILTGLNGSGKTTLLSCITGLIRPTRGKVRIDAFDFYKDEIEYRKRLAFLPDSPRFYIELSAWEHLRFIAMSTKALDGFDQRTEDLLKSLELWHVRHHYPQHYSRGMQLKLGLAMVLIRPFEVLLLDEPTSALDQEGLTVLVKTIRQLKNEGVSILMSTHDPQLAQDLGDRHFKISHGELVEV